ncbi:CAP domain-containing protein [Sporolactobacillus shoreae]|uniref:CAP domain-containing protein n=1 Tax=Sporolactobacillus shoreae TaxID=1465501 RepID=A0A4Z0GIP4_9BACL|nr:CAP domain-containing protein [Sporolactobacillus shoreae]TGA96610.1 CAP domain-containing protein [Sporolactobacillus shoreae]
MRFFKRLFFVLVVLSVGFASVSLLNGSRAQADNSGKSPAAVKTVAAKSNVVSGVESKTLKKQPVKKAVKKAAPKKKTTSKKRAVPKKVTYKKAVKKPVKKAPVKKSVAHKTVATKKPVAKKVVYNAAPRATLSAGVQLNSSVEQQIVSLINQQRTSRGLSPLQVRSDLANFASQWSLQQYTNGTMSHGMLGFTYSTVGGQNVAYASGDVSYYGWPAIWSASATVNGWMNSPEHRANILKASYKYTGVGVAYGQKGATGWVFYTQDFAN